MACNVLYLEPFYGGSHQDFADGLISYSRHTFTLKTLPNRFWKWRMRGAALYYADQIKHPEDYDLVFTSGLMSIADLRSLWGPRCPPVIVYFHENQLSYPVPEKEERDFHFAFTDLTTALSADRVLFNSHFHREEFFAHLPEVLRLLPEYRPYWVIEAIRQKAEVVYPGIHLAYTGSEIPRGAEKGLPVIVWNHRWEFDKSPDIFFSVLYELDRKRTNFNLALVGENFQVVPKPFIEAKAHFGDRIIHYGFIPEKSVYHRLLYRSDILLSTAIQENFGISVIEAILCGCYPLLPNRLVYPEIIPKQFHTDCLYTNPEELVSRLEYLLALPSIGQPAGLGQSLEKFHWQNRISDFDSIFDGYARR